MGVKHLVSLLGLVKRSVKARNIIIPLPNLSSLQEDFDSTDGMFHSNQLSWSQALDFDPSHKSAPVRKEGRRKADLQRRACPWMLEAPAVRSFNQR